MNYTINIELKELFVTQRYSFKFMSSIIFIFLVLFSTNLTN